MLDYLRAENSYATAYFKPLQGLVDDLIADMDDRLEDVEVSAPKLSHDGGWVYYDTRGPGDDYWNTYRQPLLPLLLAAAAGSNGGGGSSLAAAVAAAMRAAQQQPAASTNAAACTKPGSSSSSNDNTNCQLVVSSSSSKEQLVLDQNRLSAGHTYWDVVTQQASPDGRLVAYLFDTVGDEDFSLQVNTHNLCLGWWESLVAVCAHRCLGWGGG